MKNKQRLIVLFTCLIFIFVLVLSGSTLFSVAEMNLKVNGNNKFVSAESLQKSLNSFKGENILFLDKSKIEKKVEKDFPFVKILNIEKRFPNVIKISIKEKDAVFAVTTMDKQIIIDSYGTIIDEVAYAYKFDNLIEILNVSVEDISYTETGDKVILKNVDYNKLNEVYRGILSCGIDSFSLVKSVAFERDKVMLSSTTGVTIDVYSPNVKLGEKVVYGVACFSELSDVQKVSGKLIVYEGQDGVIKATHSIASLS